MGRILSIDYGRKRCGIAVTDELRIIANPLDYVPTHQLIDFLEKYFLQNTVDIVVVGEPIDMRGNVSESEAFIKPFVKTFANKFPNIKLERFDERFTSRMALKSMIDAGSKKKDRREKGNIDKISATIILQSFLEYGQK